MEPNELSHKYNPAPKLVGDGAYEYKPLPDGAEGNYWIRTLRLQPGSQDETVDCILQDTCLKAIGSVTKYEALSYSWGNSKDTTIIRCNGLKLRVTSSLHAALVAFRDQHDVRTIWADAVCINQQDPHERSEQVSIMAKIYDQAEQVIVWLGPAADDSRLAFNLSRKLARHWKRNPTLNVIADLETPIGALRERYGLPTSSLSAEYTALRKLLQRTWFTRVWVIQEVIAARTAILKCGPDEMPWDDFAGGIYWASGAPVLDQVSPAIVSHLCQLMAIRRRPADNPYSLSFLLGLFSPCEATDPRDKVFALYAMKMLPRMSALQKEIETVGIVPDYSINYDTLYIQCFKDIISTSGSLDILYHVGIEDHSNEDLPSWVPDISRSKSSDQLTENKDFLCASMNSKASCRLEGRTLVLKGMIVDTISEIGEVCPRPPIVDSQPTLGELIRSSLPERASNYLATVHAFADWDRIATQNGPNTPNPTAESRESIYWQTIQSHHRKDTDRDEMGNPRDEAVMNQSYTAFFRRRWLSRLGYATGQHNMFVKQFYLYLIYKHWEWSGSVIRSILLFTLWPSLNWYIFAIFVILQETWNRLLAGHDGMENLFYNRMFVWNRRLVRTKKGFLAIVPASSLAGDSVAILTGGRAPFVLREAPGGWKLLGEGFFHGMMKGEEFEEDRCEEICIV